MATESEAAWGLAMRNKGIAHFMAKKLWDCLPRVRQLGDMDDLVQEAMVLLLDAARKYSDGIGCRFSTYAAQAVKRGLVRRAFATALIRVPQISAAAAIRGTGRDGRGRLQLGPAALRQALAALDGHSRLGRLAEGRHFKKLPRDDGPGAEGLLCALGRLRPGERDLATRLFGLDGRNPVTGEQLAVELRVSRAEINRRLLLALARLRGFLTGTFWDWDEAG